MGRLSRGKLTLRNIIGRDVDKHSRIINNFSRFNHQGYRKKIPTTKSRRNPGNINE